MSKFLLVVDDDPVISNLVATIATRAGYQVQTAYDGADVYIDPTSRPDVILLDWHMPKEDGVSLCRRLRADPETQNVPIILMSSEEPQVAQPDIDAFIAKPFAINKVRALIDHFAKQGRQK